MRLRNLLMTAATAAMALAFGACGDGDDGVIELDPGSDTEAQDSKSHFFLCFGQSNMEGNAAIQSKDKSVDPRFQAYVCFAGQYDGRDCKVGDLRAAVPPLCRAGQSGGIGVTDYFGRAMVASLPQNERVRVAVVALGGTAIDGFLEETREAYIKSLNGNWLAGYYSCYNNKPYDRMIEVAKKAIKNGDSFDGILFHQGETDAYSPEWNKKVKKIYDNICKDLGVKNVPFLAGNVTGNGNQCIKSLPSYIDNCHVISSAGCPGDDANDNAVHFNHEGYEKMGAKYAEEMLKIMGK